MSDAVIITVIICSTLIVLCFIGKIKTPKVTTYFYDTDTGKCMGVKDEYK